MKKKFALPFIMFLVLTSISLGNSQNVFADEAKRDDAKSIAIVSGKAWVVTRNPGPDCPAADCLRWTTIDYNDSAWVSPALSNNHGAGGTVTNVNDVVPGTRAKFMWFPSADTVAYFRYKFTLDLDAKSRTLPLLGHAFVGADDFFELWVNGNFVTSGLLAEHRVGNDWFPQIADLTPYLQAGPNVIAIRANDGGCKTTDSNTGLCARVPFASDGTYNGEASIRSFRNLFFDGVIETVDSEEIDRRAQFK